MKYGSDGRWGSLDYATTYGAKLKTSALFDDNFLVYRKKLGNSDWAIGINLTSPHQIIARRYDAEYGETVGFGGDLTAPDNLWNSYSVLDKIDTIDYAALDLVEKHPYYHGANESIPSYGSTFDNKQIELDMGGTPNTFTGVVYITEITDAGLIRKYFVLPGFGSLQIAPYQVLYHKYIAEGYILFGLIYNDITTPTSSFDAFKISCRYYLLRENDLDYTLLDSNTMPDTVILNTNVASIFNGITFFNYSDGTNRSPHITHYDKNTYKSHIYKIVLDNTNPAAPTISTVAVDIPVLPDGSLSGDEQHANIYQVFSTDDSNYYYVIKQHIAMAGKWRTVALGSMYLYDIALLSGNTCEVQKRSKKDWSLVETYDLTPIGITDLGISDFWQTAALNNYTEGISTLTWAKTETEQQCIIPKLQNDIGYVLIQDSVEYPILAAQVFTQKEYDMYNYYGESTPVYTNWNTSINSGLFWLTKTGTVGLGISGIDARCLTTITQEIQYTGDIADLANPSSDTPEYYEKENLTKLLCGYSFSSALIDSKIIRVQSVPYISRQKHPWHISLGPYNDCFDAIQTTYMKFFRLQINEEKPIIVQENKYQTYKVPWTRNNYTDPSEYSTNLILSPSPYQIYQLEAKYLFNTL